MPKRPAPRDRLVIASARRRTFRQRLFVTFLTVLALASARQLVIAPGHGQDFRDFFAAATLVAEGRDPYNVGALAEEQNRLYNQPGHLKPGDLAFYDAVPYPQGPWVAMALIPVTPLPWQVAYVIYLVGAITALAASGWALLRLFGWSGRPLRLAVGAILFSPVAFINIFQGQPVPFLLAAFAGAWALHRGNRPMLAGALMAVAWIKPHIGLPLLLVLGIVEPAPVRRLITGFLLGSAALFVVAALALREALLEWPQVVFGQWSGALQQADLASINAFYYPALHGGLRQGAVALVALAAAGYAIRVVRQHRDRPLVALTLLLLTLLAAPYAHSYDALLLLPVVLALLGAQAQRWADPPVEIALWAFAIFPVLYFAGLHVGYFNGFTAIPVALLGVAWHLRLRPAPAGSALAVAA